MSSKNTNEKVLEIDAHVSKHYDIVRRLGKGVIFFFIFFIFTNHVYFFNHNFSNRNTSNNFEIFYPNITFPISSDLYMKYLAF